MKKRKLKKNIKNMFLISILVIIIGSSFTLLKSLNKENKLDAPNKEIPKTDESNNQNNTNTAKLTLVGDLLFEEPYYNAIKNGEDKSKYFSLVKEYFEKDDLSIGNMEVVIGNDSLVSSGTGYNFCAPKWVGDEVSALDFEVLSTANNHAYDRGSNGVISTIDYFKNNSDILTVGTFKEKEDIENLNILEINNIKFGFLAYTMSTNIKPDKNSEYMVSYYKSPYSSVVTEQDKERMKKQIEKLKQEVDVTIVLMHWGSEFTFTPNDTQKDLVEFFNSLGVNIVVGNHSHNIQPIEWVGTDFKTLVYYSLGNFVSADDNIPRTTPTFNNAYQFGLLSSLEVTKNNHNISISNISTEPIISYYNNNLRDFTLVPYHLYNDDYEKNHKRYQNNFNKDFIKNTYESVISKEFRD